MSNSDYSFLLSFSEVLLFSMITMCMLTMQAQTVNAISTPNINNTEVFSYNKEKVIDRVLCNFGKRQVEMVLTSPSGDSLADDTTLWFVQSGQAVVANAGNPGYVDFPFIKPKTNSICDRASVFKLAKGCIAVPLFLSDRPNLDLLAVAVYDPQAHKVLKYRIMKSYYSKEPRIRTIKNGFSYMAVSAQPNDSPEGIVETWLNVTWDGKNLVKKWDHSRAEVRH